MADLFQYGPPLVAWLLFLSRRHHEDGAHRSLRQVLLGLAVSLTALSPAVYAAIGGLSGVPHLARLLGHGAMLFAAWAAQDFLAYMNGRRGSRWHAWWTGAVFGLMCVLFALTPDLLPQSPWVFEYVVVYVIGQAPAFGNIIRLGARYVRQATDNAVRASMCLVVAGTAAALAYLLNKAVLTASSRFGFPYDLGHSFVAGKLLPGTAHVLVLAGLALPGVLGFVRRYRLYRRLGPLWWALYRADPSIALDPPKLIVSRLRLYRRVIEIRDGLLALRPFRDPAVAAAARRRATPADDVEAVVEAALIAAALRARAHGTTPANADEPVTGGGDLDSDTAFLGRVALAYRRTE